MSWDQSGFEPVQADNSQHQLYPGEVCRVAQIHIGIRNETPIVTLANADLLLRRFNTP